jgi:hypothetical protein
MIFTAMILICEINMSNSFDTCLVFSSLEQYETEESCMSAISDLLNDSLFQNTYVDYKFEEYICYPWLQIKT